MRFVLNLAFLMSPCLLMGAVIFVNHAQLNNSEDGTNWGTAFRDLQDGLKVAKQGDEIWVASGVYYPTDGADRRANFSLNTGVSLYGGFLGIESSLDSRDVKAYKTILSGNIGSKETYTDNCFNVVRCISGFDVVLDGFIVQDGNATAPEPFERGGAVFCKNANIEISNCTFSRNRASYGAALYFLGGTVAYVTNCLIEDNHAEVVGGAVYSFLRCNTIIDNSKLLYNQADSICGAMYSFQSETELHNSLVAFNYAPSVATGYFTNSSQAFIYSSNLIYSVAQDDLDFRVENISSLNVFNSVVVNDEVDPNNERILLGLNSSMNHEYSLVKNQLEDSDWALLYSWFYDTRRVRSFYEDPREVSEDSILYYLHPLMIDNGSDQYVYSELDFFGNPRINGSSVDIGLIESQPELTTYTEYLSNGRGVRVFPNPVIAGKFIIPLTNRLQKNTEVYLHDLVGRIHKVEGMYYQGRGLLCEVPRGLKGLVLCVFKHEGQWSHELLFIN